jgi:hypothetical protein
MLRSLRSESHIPCDFCGLRQVDLLPPSGIEGFKRFEAAERIDLLKREIELANSF